MLVSYLPEKNPNENEKIKLADPPQYKV